MPKIRQTIAVLIAAAFCIGFNTFRYPAVWDMVAAAPQASRPAGSNAAAATPAASREPDNNSSSEPAANTHAGVVCKDGVCTMAQPETPVASMPGSMPNYEQGEPKPAAGPSYDAESKSRDSDAESNPKETESGYKAKGSETEYPSKTPQSEYPSKTPESNFKSNDAEPGSMPKETGIQPDSNQTGPKPDGRDPSAEPPKSESASYPSGPTDERKTERGPAARLVSESYAAKPSADNAEARPVASETLVPIERPRSRARDAASGLGQTATAGQRGPGYPSADPSAPMSDTDRDSDSKKIRHLPAAGQGPDSDSASPPPTITPELMRTYRVTPAK